MTMITNTGQPTGNIKAANNSSKSKIRSKAISKQGCNIQFEPKSSVEGMLEWCIEKLASFTKISFVIKIF